MSSQPVEAFGFLLKRLRLTGGLTQEALAERAGISAKAVSDLERNPARIARLETVTLLADALQLPIAQRADLLAAARPHEAAPPPPSADLRSVRRLPRPLTPLLGRVFEVGTLESWLRGSQDQLISLTGPAGVGKTRLAIAVATRSTDAFDDAAFVDLTPLSDPNLVIPTIARSLGVREENPTRVGERLAEVLRPRHLLLVIDNVEHVIACRAALLDLVERCPRLVVLATSREALGVRGERVFALAPLVVPAAASSTETLVYAPAVELFIQRARAVGADLDQDETTLRAMAEICRRLDGLPLAIELAAAWTPFLPPLALLRRLASRLSLLVGGPHDLPARQQTMRDAIAWSYGLLSAREQRLFRRLGMFANGCSAEAAASVCAEEGDEPALAWLAELSRKSLVRMPAETIEEDPRAMLLATIREFAQERLVAEGELEALGGRHAAYFRLLAETAAGHLIGRDQVRWGDDLEREQDNLRAALRWAIDVRDRELSLGLAGSLWRFWRARGYVGEGRRWLDEVLALGPFDDNGDALVPLRVNALLGATLLAAEQGDLDAAATFSNQSLAHVRERDSPHDLIAALNARGLVEQLCGHYRDAATAYEEALNRARDSGDRIGEATALGGLGSVATHTGEMTRAIGLLEASLAVFRVVDDPLGTGDVLMNLNLHVYSRGDCDRAVALGEEALSLFRALGDSRSMALALLGLGLIRRTQGHLDLAAALLEQSLALRRARRDEPGLVQSLNGLAQVALDQGDISRARSLIAEAQVVMLRVDDPFADGMTRTVSGYIAIALGEWQRAREQLMSAARLLQAIGSPLFLCGSLEGLVTVAAADGNWDVAARLDGACAALQRRLGSTFYWSDPATYERTVTAIRDALGVDGFAVAYAAGEQQPLDEVLAEAKELGGKLD